MARKRNRYADRTKVGSSVAVPFQQGEGKRARHARRLETNVAQFADEARKWADARDVQFKITNDGHHWKFDREGKRVEWWPSSAKCVVDHQWRNGIHVHDWMQLEPILLAAFQNCPIIKGESATMDVEREYWKLKELLGAVQQ